MTETISCPQFVTLFSADAMAKLVSRHLVFSEFVYLVADSICVPIGYTNHNEANALVNRTRETNEEARMLNGTRDVYKIALLGSEGSGKTALLVRFLTGRYIVDYDPTIEDTYRKIFVFNDEPESVDILDTATTGDVKSELRKDFLKHGDAFVIVYSVTDRSSFDMVQVYRQEILDARESRVQHNVKLVGNKTDLEKERQVSTYEGKKMAEKYDWTFCEASAASNIGISDVFFGLNEVTKHSLAEVLGSSSDSDCSTCSTTGEEPRVKTKKKSSHHRRAKFKDLKLFRWHSQPDHI